MGALNWVRAGSRLWSTASGSEEMVTASLCCGVGRVPGSSVRLDVLSLSAWLCHLSGLPGLLRLRSSLSFFLLPAEKWPPDRPGVPSKRLLRNLRAFKDTVILRRLGLLTLSADGLETCFSLSTRCDKAHPASHTNTRDPTHTPRPHKHPASPQTPRVPTNTPRPHKHPASPQTPRVSTNTPRLHKHPASPQTPRVPTNTPRPTSTPRPHKHPASPQTPRVPTNTPRLHKHPASPQTPRVPTNTPRLHKHPASPQAPRVPTNTPRPHKHPASPQTPRVPTHTPRLHKQATPHGGLGGRSPLPALPWRDYGYGV
ncbi:unnamed protein product [Boreogadus saida]